MSAEFNISTDSSNQEEIGTLLSRIAENPRPALLWGGVAAALLLVEIGALFSGSLLVIKASYIGFTAAIEVTVGLFAAVPGVSGFTDFITDSHRWFSVFIEGMRGSGPGADIVVAGSNVTNWFGFLPTAADIPTLLSRELVPNAGYKASATGPWKGTFLGLEPAHAWLVRVGLVYAYSAAVFYWMIRGFFVYRKHYRYANWTPRDDMIDRLRGHRWAQFGIVVGFIFVTMAFFGPTLGPTTVEHNIMSPYSPEGEFQYFNAETGEVETALPGAANLESKSKGGGDQNVGVWSYDDFGRFHPFGTLTSGRDLFTYMMGGARLTMSVAAISLFISSFIASVMSLLTAYYKGLLDKVAILVSDGIVSIPQLLLLILLGVMFKNHWLVKILDGGLLIALIFGFTGAPSLWRVLRGPAFQVSEQEWIDAAKSFGQPVRTTMKKHMFPYITGYLLVYASMSIGGIVIGMAALSFLGNGLGIQPPTPAWGRAISNGQSYVSTQSWHISIIPGLMIVIVVMGMNALGDGIRDAIDPESDADVEGESQAGGSSA
jgi:peptide/nickel transport system permease protein